MKLSNSAKATSNTKSEQMSELAGQIHEQHVRCGKPGCRCAKGDPHGPYYYRIWRDGTRVHKVYVKGEEVEEIRAACDSHKHYMEQLREFRNKRREMVVEMNQAWRVAKSLLNSKGPS